MGVVIRQKAKGRGQPWWVFVSHEGKRKSMKIGDKRSAEKVAAGLRKKLASGKFEIEPEKKMPSFGECSKKWLQEYVKINRRESTFDEYEGILKKHVLPVFKNKKIDSISRGDVKVFLLSKFNSGLSISRIKIIKDVVSGVFNYAVDEETIKSNPVSGITKRFFPKAGTKKKVVQEEAIFTKEELELLLNTCQAGFPEYYPFFLMASRTGMRLGELLALEWADIDFNSNYIWVKRSYRRGRFTRPKNDNYRKVDMSNQLTETLQAFLTAQKRRALRQGTGEVPGFVFHRNGRVIEQDFARRIYVRVLKKAKLRYIKFHGLRHAFCALLLSEGVSPYYVSQQAGHSSINITCDIYGSWVRNEENRHVNLLDLGHQSAPQAHPARNDKPQPIEITAISV